MNLRPQLAAILLALAIAVTAMTFRAQTAASQHTCECFPLAAPAFEVATIKPGTVRKAASV